MAIPVELFRFVQTDRAAVKQFRLYTVEDHLNGDNKTLLHNGHCQFGQFPLNTGKLERPFPPVFWTSSNCDLNYFNLNFKLHDTIVVIQSDDSKLVKNAKIKQASWRSLWRMQLR